MHDDAQGGQQTLTASGDLIYHAGLILRAVRIRAAARTTTHESLTMKRRLSRRRRRTRGDRFRKISHGLQALEPRVVLDGEISIVSSNLVVGEEESFVEVVVHYTGDTQNEASFDFWLVDGEAVNGQDYLGPTASLPSSRSVGGGFLPPDPWVETINVTILNDVELESDETFTAMIGNVQGATLGNSSVQITIEDDEVPTTISVEDAEQLEGSGTPFTLFMFTVTASPVVDRSIEINATVSGGSATGVPFDEFDPEVSLLGNGEQDFFTDAENSLFGSIGANQESGTFYVVVWDDLVDEYNETFTVNITSPTSGVSIGQGSATGTIIDDDGDHSQQNDLDDPQDNDPCECPCECGGGSGGGGPGGGGPGGGGLSGGTGGGGNTTYSVSSFDGNNRINHQPPGTPGLTYNSKTNPHPVIRVEALLPSDPTKPLPVQFEVRPKLGGVDQPPLFYDPDPNLVAGGPVTFAIPGDASSLDTGSQDWEAKVIAHFADGTSAELGTSTDSSGVPASSFAGRFRLINLLDGPLGRGWSIDGLDRLVPDEDGVLWVRSNGHTAFFQGNGPSFTTPAAFFDKLVQNPDDTYTLSDKFGNRAEFTVTGLLDRRVDRHGNVTQYTYTDADGDGEVDDISTITDPFGRTTTYSYNATTKKIELITDFAGRQTLLLHDGLGRLVLLVSPDPDGAGPQPVTFTGFSYVDANSSAISHITEALSTPEQRTTEFEYDWTGAVTKIIHPDGTFRQIQPVQTVDLPVVAGGGGGGGAGSAGVAVAAKASDVVGFVIDENGNKTEFTTDRFGMITSISDAAGFETTIDRNDDGLATTVNFPDPDLAADGSTDGPREALTVTYQYDTRGNLTVIREKNPSGQTLRDYSWNYDATWNVPTLYIDGENNTTDYTIDPTNGDVTRIERNNGHPLEGDAVTDLTYSSEGFLLSIVEEIDSSTSRTTRFEYLHPTFDDLPTAIYWADGTAEEISVSMEYDAAHNVSAVVDELGRRTEYLYDNLDRLIQVTDPDPDGAGPKTSPVSSLEYDLLGRQRFTTDPLGNVTEYLYDKRHRLTRVILPDPDGDPLTVNTPEWNYQYDDVGNLRFVTDPEGRMTERVFDERNLIERLVLPDPDLADPLVTSPEWSYVYDAVGAVVSVTDPRSQTTDYEYDVLLRREKAIGPDPDGAGPLDRPETVFAYDDNNLITSLTDPSGNTTSYTYDDLNRLRTEMNELGLSRTYEYDQVGNLISATDRNGRRIDYTYDLHDQLRLEEWYDTSSTLVGTLEYTYDYDDGGRLLTAADLDPTFGSQYTFTYDDLGRLQQQLYEGPFGLEDVLLAYSYDANSNLEAYFAYYDGLFDSGLLYTYDDLNRATSVGQTGVGLGLTTKLAEFDYNLAGQITELRRYNNGGAVVATSNLAYDDLGRLETLVHTPLVNPGTDTITYAYEYDASSRITEIDSSTDGLTTFDYDELGQLTDADFTSQSDENYTYDDNGNRTNAGYTTDDDNRLTSDGTYNYTYDGEGNRVTRTRITDGQFTEYTFDHRNRLTRVDVYTDDTKATLVEVTEYTYDAFDRRIARRHDDVSPTDLTDAAIELYAYDGDNVLLDFVDTDGTAGPNTPQKTMRYLFGPAIDMVLAQEDLQTGEILWHLADHQGTVRDLLDNTGMVVEHIQYDAFGKPISVTDAQTGASLTEASTRYLYTGREWDSDVELYYYRARWYDPGTGRFISQDPIGFGGGDANLYRYVANSSVNARDPSGREPWNYHYQLWRAQQRQNEISKLEADRRRAQDRLDYLRALLSELIRIGDEFALAQAAKPCGGFNANEWKVLRPHLVYALENYRTIGFFGIGIHDASSSNWPIMPGFSLDQSTFYADDASALTIYVHEPMHDLRRFGIGHRRIDEIIGPRSDTNMFQRFIDFLNNTKSKPGGQSIFSEARHSCLE